MVEIFVGIILLVIGLSVGSFLNMAIFRLAVEYKLKNFKLQTSNKNRSYCDYCGKQLHWYENVPVLSWIIQYGKTRCCGNPLPWEYPLIELGTGIAFLIFNLKFFQPQADQLLAGIIYLIIISLLIFSLVFDLKYMILPDRTNLALIIISLFLLINNENYFSFILAGIGSLFFFFILNRIKIRKSEAMGMGDVKYSLFMGLFLGWPNVLVAIYFAFVVGAVISIFLLFFKIVKKESPIPFGPFLILGTVVAKVWGETLMKFLITNY